MKTVVCISILAATAHFTFAETLIVPFGAESRENPGNSAFPFSGGPGNGRSQQVYSNTIFPALSEPGQVFQLDSIAFRLSSQGTFGGGAQASFDRLEILISSKSGPFTLDLAQNHGANQQVVYDGSLDLAGIVPPGVTPSSFDLRIDFMEPFIYGRADGDLVVEIRKFGTENFNRALAAAAIPGVTFFQEGAFGVETLGNVGLETVFSYQVIPEPSVAAIFAIGALVFIGYVRKRS